MSGGRIEEIGATYVVAVSIWDLRRLVVPSLISSRNAFQNWTRTSAAILGTVFLYVDYSVSVEEVRRELHAILESSKLWDGKVWNCAGIDGERRRTYRGTAGV